jgi:hypothetical protein
VRGGSRSALTGAACASPAPPRCRRRRRLHEFSLCRRGRAPPRHMRRRVGPLVPQTVPPPWGLLHRRETWKMRPCLAADRTSASPRTAPRLQRGRRPAADCSRLHSPSIWRAEQGRDSLPTGRSPLLLARTNDGWEGCATATHPAGNLHSFAAELLLSFAQRNYLQKGQRSIAGDYLSFPVSYKE